MRKSSLQIVESCKKPNEDFSSTLSCMREDCKEVANRAKGLKEDQCQQLLSRNEAQYGLGYSFWVFPRSLWDLDVWQKAKCLLVLIQRRWNAGRSFPKLWTVILLELYSDCQRSNKLITGNLDKPYSEVIFSSCKLYICRKLKPCLNQPWGIWSWSLLL